MFSTIGIPGLILILMLTLILFGPSKLPQLGRAVGETLREFRSSTKEIMDDLEESVQLDDGKKSKQTEQNTT